MAYKLRRTWGKKKIITLCKLEDLFFGNYRVVETTLTLMIMIIGEPSQMDRPNGHYMM